MDTVDTQIDFVLSAFDSLLRAGLFDDAARLLDTVDPNWDHAVVLGCLSAVWPVTYMDPSRWYLFDTKYRALFNLIPPAAVRGLEPIDPQQEVEHKGRKPSRWFGD